jgi:diazepam-binding inhibitor (GABA receptor modulating acyl-CoA-binding protein)
MELKDKFKKAVVESREFAIRPDNDTLLKIYSLYKHATEGDNNAEQPGMFDFVAKAKYEAWNKLKGMSADDAMQHYVDTVDGLK